MAGLIDYRCMGLGTAYVGWVGFGSMKWTHGQLCSSHKPIAACPLSHPNFLAECDLGVTVRLRSGYKVTVIVRVRVGARIVQFSRGRRLLEVIRVN